MDYLLLGDLEAFCRRELNGNAMTIDALREKLDRIPDESLACSRFFHELLRRDDVAPDMVRLVLQRNPAVTGVQCHGAFPIWAACSNERCPNSVVELLARGNPSALGHLSTSGCLSRQCDEDRNEAKGTALHLYLSRISNMELSTVKTLVGLCPESLGMCGDSKVKFYPIHALVGNERIRDFEHVLKYIIDADPTSLQRTDSRGQVPLFYAVSNPGLTANVAQVLVDGWKESTHQRERIRRGFLPIHCLCENSRLDEATRLDVLRILIEANPGSILTRGGLAGNSPLGPIQGSLPIHLASGSQDSSFCRMLVEPHPETLAMDNGLTRSLPIHIACDSGSLDTVKYLLEAAPETINAASPFGDYYPIHLAVRRRDGFEFVQHLLQTDPTCASKTATKASEQRRYFPLQAAYEIGEDVRVLKLVFDAYPAAIFTFEQVSQNAPATSFPQNYEFIMHQLNDFSVLSESPLPIHRCMYANATLGVVKLLVEIFPGDVHAVDDDGQLPLHLACKFGKTHIVQYLTSINQEGLLVCDAKGSRPLHYACQFGHYGVVNCLVEVSSVSVSERNSDGKLPFQLLIEADCEKESLAYTESVWRLLVASPDVLLEGL